MKVSKLKTSLARDLIMNVFKKSDQIILVAFFIQVLESTPKSLNLLIFNFSSLTHKLESLENQ